MKKEKRDVYQVTGNIIRRLELGKNKDADTKAILAALRDSIGRPLKEADRVWPMLFESLPSSFLGTKGRETYEEAAIYSTLQIYAICMQGATGNVIVDYDMKESIGKSLGTGRRSDESQALDRRFNAMMTAVTFEEFIYHLRHMIKIVKSKVVIPINFARLADDLFWYQMGKNKDICFKWATDYYSSVNITGEDTPEKKEESSDVE
ncbi:MAG: type I-E CRISPR-associated protein Cse2/CasB [Lachnospiraceae bacterium]|nr:type I-E CRISPR-associated protein Cse2/CasB [Lachnospiraceae bacterium]